MKESILSAEFQISDSGGGMEDDGERIGGNIALVVGLLTVTPDPPLKSLFA